MTDRTKVWLILGIGLIMVAITLVLFLLGFSGGEKGTLHWISLLFILIAEAALIAGLVLMTNRSTTLNSTLLKAGLMSTFSLYLIITVLLAVFNPLFGESINAFVTTQVTICGIAAIVVIALVISASAKA